MVHLNRGVLEAFEHLPPGGHILSLYQSEDNKVDLLAAFLSQGVTRGERGAFAGDRLSDAAWRRFHERLPGLGQHLREGRVLLLPGRLGGGKPASGAGDTIREVAAAARREGYQGLRLVWEMTWLLDLLADNAAFDAFLTGLDHILAPSRTTMLSQFREEPFLPQFIYQVLRRHPVIVIGDRAFVNSCSHRPGRTEELPDGWSGVLEEFPDPLLIDDGRRQRANIRLRALAEEAALAGRDLLNKLSDLWNGDEKGYRLDLSEGRSFTFRPVALSGTSSIRLIMGRETVPVKTPDPEAEAGQQVYARFLEALPLGFLEIDPRGRIVSANARTADLLGMTRDKILHRSYLDLVHPLDRPKAALWLGGGGQDALELRLHRRRGECWVKMRLVPSFAPDLKGIIWEDVNDRKRSEVLQLLNEELVTLQDRLRFLSTRDALTGLFNRQYFQEEVRRLQNPRFAPVSVIIADVDGLKPINDQFGHPVGDELLQTAARVLKRPFRETDMVARIGGDEFAILLPRTPYGLARERREEIFREVALHNLDTEGPQLSLSVGVATSAGNNTLLQETIKQADDDMYRCKLARSNYPDDDHPLTTLGGLFGHRAATGPASLENTNGKLLS